MLKTLGANKDAALPLKLFEVGDVILPEPEAETGARNERRLVALYSGKESGFEVVHGLLNRLMQVLGVPLLSTPPPFPSVFACLAGHCLDFWRVLVFRNTLFFPPGCLVTSSVASSS